MIPGLGNDRPPPKRVELPRPTPLQLERAAKAIRDDAENERAYLEDDYLADLAEVAAWLDLSAGQDRQAAQARDLAEVGRPDVQTLARMLVAVCGQTAQGGKLDVDSLYRDSAEFRYGVDVLAAMLPGMVAGIAGEARHYAQAMALQAAEMQAAMIRQAADAGRFRRP